MLLIIEGDPSAIRHLLNELAERNYLGDDEFNYTTAKAKDMSNEDTWQEFRRDFEYFLGYGRKEKKS